MSSNWIIGCYKITEFGPIKLYKISGNLDWKEAMLMLSDKLFRDRPSFLDYLVEMIYKCSTIKEFEEEASGSIVVFTIQRIDEIEVVS